MKYCSFCACEHPLTQTYWYGLEVKPKCRVRVIERQKTYYKENQDQRVAYAAQYRTKNAETLREKDRIRYSTPKRKASTKQYRSSPKGRESINARRRQRTADDINFRLSMRLRVRLVMAVRNGQKGGSAVRDLGCSVAKLREHLESQFQEGMTWETYGQNGWHIDHIKPLSNFDLQDKTQFQQAVHYTNLQPLWAEDNLRKSNKVI